MPCRATRLPPPITTSNDPNTFAGEGCPSPDLNHVGIQWLVPAAIKRFGLSDLHIDEAGCDQGMALEYPGSSTQRVLGGGDLCPEVGGPSVTPECDLGQTRSNCSS
jgi:hypothetical protein